MVRSGRPRESSIPARPNRNRHSSNVTEGPNLKIAAIAGAVLLGALLIFIGAFGARWLVPAPTSSAVKPAQPSTTPAVTAMSGNTVPDRLDLTAIRQLLAVIEPGKRAQIIESKEKFEEFIKQETIGQAVLAAAYANGADANDGIRVLMERAGQRVLSAAYLNRVVQLNLDPDFPSEEQTREAYDNNPALFKVPQRIHLWQIFIPLSTDADNTESEQAWQLAERISGRLKSGDDSFEVLAKKHSAHAPSRVNDGYMGLIKVTELLPAIAAAAAKLPENGVSEPIASETGLHIIRRGAAVAEEILAYEAVRATIRQRLIQEATIKVRQAAIEKISDEYPVEAPQEDFEAWREILAKEVQQETEVRPVPSGAST